MYNFIGLRKYEFFILRFSLINDDIVASHSENFFTNEKPIVYCFVCVVY